MSANTYTLCTGLLIAGLVSACGSDDDSTMPTDTQVPVESDSPTSGDATNSGNTEPGLVETGPVETNGESGQTAMVGMNLDSGDDSIEPDVSNLQNDGAQANTILQPEQVNSDVDSTDTDQAEVQPVVNNARVNFGTAKLLVDLVPDGDSYPAKFHLAGDKLYFWTVDTDPRFANCSSHWSRLNDEDKNIAFNLVATDPETGVVAMNKQIMTLGDFADDPNDTCAGYKGTIMQVFEPNWITPASATGEQQFVVHYSSPGSDQVWRTDGSESNTRQLNSGSDANQVYFEGDKVFFLNDEGLSVSNTLSGDRRKLFEVDPDRPIHIKRIARSPSRQATFEMDVAFNRAQIWTYDLDTDGWEKAFVLKPDTSIYTHYETLMVDGQTLLSRGYDSIGAQSALGFNSGYGDLTSFEILTDSRPIFANADRFGSPISLSGDNKELFYTTTDFSVGRRIISAWSYTEERNENVFMLSEPGLLEPTGIAGQDGRFYIAGIKQTPESAYTLELWSYDPQTAQLIELSGDDWYAVKPDQPSPDEGYVFRYLNTPDGLMFVNLKDDSGRELWFTDGTHEGTRQLSDINPGAGSSNPEYFYYSEDAIYFSANDGIHGIEPWMIQISR